MKFRLGTPISLENFKEPVPIKDEPKEIIYKTKSERIGDILLVAFITICLLPFAAIALALISLFVLLGIAVYAKFGFIIFMIYACYIGGIMCLANKL